MEVGQDLYTKCSTLHISRKCKPALFSQNKRKHLFSKARFCIESDLICIFEENAILHIVLPIFIARICVYTKWPMLHFIRKNILSNTYDGLLAMKFDS